MCVCVCVCYTYILSIHIRICKFIDTKMKINKYLNVYVSNLGEHNSFKSDKEINIIFTFCFFFTTKRFLSLHICFIPIIKAIKAEFLLDKFLNILFPVVMILFSFVFSTYFLLIFFSNSHKTWFLRIRTISVSPWFII